MTRKQLLEEMSESEAEEGIDNGSILVRNNPQDIFLKCSENLINMRHHVGVAKNVIKQSSSESNQIVSGRCCVFGIYF